MGADVTRTIAEWVDECRSWTGVLLDALKSLEAANERVKELERENVQLSDRMAQLRRQVSAIDAERTELRSALGELARQIAHVGDLTRRHMET